VNKNTVIAFLLMILTIAFFARYDVHFNWPFVRKKEPIEKVQRNIINETKENETKQNVTENDSIIKSIDKKKFEKDTSTEGTQEETSINENTLVDIDTIWIENKNIICGITEMGGNIISVKMKDYFYSKENKEEKNEYIELIPRNNKGGANLSIDNKSYDNNVFRYQEYSNNIQVTDDSVTTNFIYTTPSGMNITKTFTFYKEGYKIGYLVKSNEFGGRNVGTGWLCGIQESEQSQNAQNARFEEKYVHVYDGKDYTKKKYKENGAITPETGELKWAAVTSKYFLTALVAQQNKSADFVVNVFEDDPYFIKKKEIKKKNYGIEVIRYSDDTSQQFWFYVGPTKRSILKSHDIKLQKVLYGGWKWFFGADKWFPALCELTLSILLFLQSIVKDYGIAILLITILMKLVTYPMTQTSMKSMSRMKDIQPKVNAIKEKYKNKPQKMNQMNQEIMEMYKKEGVNPLNPGCLPMFLQMPILISLFVVLRKAIELRGATTILLPWVDDLSKAEVLFKLPFGWDIPMYGENFALIPVIMAVLTFVQNKMTMKDPSQQGMVYIMPVFMMVMFNNFPAGLVLYWTFSSALGLVQQTFINKKKEDTKNIKKTK